MLLHAYSFHRRSSPSVLVYNVLNFYFVFADGSGVPPGTIPKTCKTCKGSGVVCILRQYIFAWHISYRSVSSLNNRWQFSMLIWFANPFCFSYSNSFFLLNALELKILTVFLFCLVCLELQQRFIMDKR